MVDIIIDGADGANGASTLRLNEATILDCHTCRARMGTLGSLARDLYESNVR
jgi:hypothetical protein